MATPPPNAFFGIQVKMNGDKEAGNIMSHLLSFHPSEAQQSPAPFIPGKQARWDGSVKTEMTLLV